MRGSKMELLMSLALLRKALTSAGQTGVLNLIKASIGNGMVQGFRTSVEDLWAKAHAEMEEDLQWVHEACQNALAGHWDCSTEEGIQGFKPVIERLQNVAACLDITLTMDEGYYRGSEGSRRADGSDSQKRV